MTVNRVNVSSESATWRIIEGDCRDTLAALPAGSVQTVVTSPPYFGLRDYGTGEWDGGDPGCDHRGPPAASATASTLKNDGRPAERVGQNNYERQAGAVYRDKCGKCGARRVDNQLGLEPTPDDFVSALVEVFRAVRRVLRDDGTVWLNIGDSYAANGTLPAGCKAKDLIGVPWMVAFALRADGWYLRSDIIWAKPNPMPESVTDRPTKAHEYVFLLAKGPRYFYDADAVREAHLTADDGRNRDDYEASRERNVGGRTDGLTRTSGAASWPAAGRNKRSVWTVATQPYPGAHFATFPPKLIEPCILAGCPVGGVVLDPFAGAGTTGVVALRHGRSFIGCELNAEYVTLARNRIVDDAPLLNSFAEDTT